MEHPVDLRRSINTMIRTVCFFFSVALLCAAYLAMFYTGESTKEVWQAWCTIQTSPCQLITDYFKLGSLPASFLNAGICGILCSCLTLMPGAKFKPNVWAGFFLVIAHCFYGLNLMNLVPPMLGFFLYCKLHHLRFRDNLDWAMFITSFAPFFSEVLYRYPMSITCPIVIGQFETDLVRVGLVILMAIFVGLVLPAILPGASKLHRGFNLYNGGLATGLLGLFMYAFLYQTMGKPLPVSELPDNPIYTAHGESYMLFCSIFFAFVFVICIFYGWRINDTSFRGYRELLKSTGYQANFPKEYGVGPTWINLGIYGLMMVAIFDAAILLTDGAGFTGATCGIVFAAITFAAGGQHPKNVWPIPVGYLLLSLLVHGICALSGQPVPWTLSSQAYMNGLAFATGLCPFTGEHGWRVGILAGFISAVLCTTTSAMHGGFVLYNGGLTAGLTALLLLPLLDTYKTHSEKWGRGV